MVMALSGKKINIEKCNTEMKLSSDVRDKNGAILVSTGMQLTESILEKLKVYGIEELDIVVEEVTEITKEPVAEDLSITNEKIIRKIEELKPKVNIQSNGYYNNIIKIMEDVVEDIKKKGTINISSIKKIGKIIYKEIRSKNSILVCIELANKKGNKKYNSHIDVAIMGGLLGKWRGLSSKKVYNIILAGLLRDIGLYTLPKDLFIDGEMSEKNLALYKKHPLIAYEMIVKIKSIDVEVKKMVITHHENQVGTGYPLSLNSEKQSLESKILQVADRFNIYFKDKSREGIIETLQEFYNNEITHLDYECMKVFVKNILWNNLGRYVLLSDKSVGEIVFISEVDRFKPLIRIEDKIIDLSRNDLKIIKII
ncbi:HD domain-containing protein [Clostridium sp. D2Q-11]|uniref:HD domain-containing protein n=1 Tax=Anaeromonas frigoriresistens TaxID=2683708 RepID=A0A942Z9F7_9FIRM|nr:HD domain-containing phosphohydrolase [Anaeromonas frigoriresistens]MBS4539079.1 HD domain-containing protein [Anaeromonas frigoriresistens]